jgi:hypothetical protein
LQDALDEDAGSVRFAQIQVFRKEFRPNAIDLITGQLAFALRAFPSNNIRLNDNSISMDANGIITSNNNGFIDITFSAPDTQDRAIFIVANCTQTDPKNLAVRMRLARTGALTHLVVGDADTQDVKIAVPEPRPEIAQLGTCDNYPCVRSQCCFQTWGLFRRWRCQ